MTFYQDLKNLFLWVFCFGKQDTQNTQSTQNASVFTLKNPTIKRQLNYNDYYSHIKRDDYLY